MLELLTRLLGGADRLTRLARGADRRAFAEAFARSQVWFLCIPQGVAEGLDPATLTQEELLSQIEAAAKDLSERQEFPPFIYEADGVRYLPVFSDNKLARKFVEWYVPRVNRVLPFQVLETGGAAFGAAVGSDVTVVLNDQSPHRRELTPEDIGLIREAATGA